MILYDRLSTGVINSISVNKNRMQTSRYIIRIQYTYTHFQWTCTYVIRVHNSSLYKFVKESGQKICDQIQYDSQTKRVTRQWSPYTNPTSPVYLEPWAQGLLTLYFTGTPSTVCTYYNLLLTWRLKMIFPVLFKRFWW